MKTVYAVMEAVGNFSHTLEEFDNRDSAAEFLMEKYDEEIVEKVAYPIFSEIFSLISLFSILKINKV